MKSQRFAIRTMALVVAALLLNGCGGERTENLIEFMDPDGMVVISKSEADVLMKTLKPGEYIELNNGNFLVHKSRMKTIGDYAIITAAAPITITIDSALYVVEGFARFLQAGSVENQHSGSISIPLKWFLK